jgi:hypothetical protein
MSRSILTRPEFRKGSHAIDEASPIQAASRSEPAPKPPRIISGRQRRLRLAYVSRQGVIFRG